MSLASIIPPNLMPTAAAQVPPAEAPPDPAQGQGQPQQSAATQTQIKGLPPGAIVRPIPQLQPGERDEDYLNAIAAKDPGAAGTIKALADGRLPFPAGFALKSPYWQGMLNSVAQYDPSFDAVNYNARSQTRTKFTSGKEGQMVNNLNTAIGHVQELEAAADALHNRSFTPWNWLANKVENVFGNDAQTNFDTVVHRVAPELVAAYRGSGGAEADIQNNMKDFSSSASPAQLHGAIAETAKLLESKVRALQDQYNQGMGVTEHGLTLLRPDARAALDRLQGRPSLSGNTIKMKAPNGQIQDVPAEQVNHFKQLGAVPVNP
jgi:hypothetical protein